MRKNLTQTFRRFLLATPTYKYYKSGLINLNTVWRGLVFGFIGAISGAIIVNHISNQFMQYIVPILMLLVFIFNLFNRKLGIAPGKKRISEYIFFSIFGFILGFYDAFFGPGTGNFWIMAIVYFLGYTYIEASGYAKMLNLKSNLFSLAIFLYYGKVQFIYAVIMALGSILGNFIGAKTAILKGSKIIKPFFMVVVLINVIVSFYNLHAINL
ncbi:MAG: TSUP family transporter [Neisseriaceae bacterium]